MHRLGKPLIGASVAIQGMGKVGGTAAKYLQKEGAKITAVSDVAGGLYDPKGLDIDKIIEFVADGGRARLLKDYPDCGVQRITNDELLETGR